MIEHDWITFNTELRKYGAQNRPLCIACQSIDSMTIDSTGRRTLQGL